MNRALSFTTCGSFHRCSSTCKCTVTQSKRAACVLLLGMAYYGCCCNKLLLLMYLGSCLKVMTLHKGFLQVAWGTFRHRSSSPREVVAQTPRQGVLEWVVGPQEGVLLPCLGHVCGLAACAGHHHICTVEGCCISSWGCSWRGITAAVLAALFDKPRLNYRIRIKQVSRAVIDHLYLSSVKQCFLSNKTARKLPENSSQ